MKINLIKKKEIYFIYLDFQTKIKKENDLYTVKGSIMKVNDNTIIKQEITTLIDSFDQKFNELHEIKIQLRKLLNDGN